MKRVIGVLWLVWLVVGVSGCFSTQSLKEDPNLDALIEELVKHNIAVQEQRAETLNKGITTLTVSSGDVVTVSLSQASIPTVVNRILSDIDTPYVLADVSLHGTVTARFTDIPLIEALNRIVQGIGLVAVADNGLVVIRNSTGDTGDGSTVYREVAVKNLSQEAVTDLLDGIYPQDMDSQRTVNFGFVSSSNSVYLYGAPVEVGRAAQLLAKADREIKHVSIEVLVVEFNSGVLEEYDSIISKLVEGEFTWNVNSVDNGFIGVEWADQASPALKVTNLTGFVEMLVSDQKARLISRPFISTLSGTEAHIEIVSERYVLVGSGDSKETSNVTSGVILEITPTVLPDGRIRMDISVEDSQFSSINVQGVLSEVNKNAAQTIMQVNDGQTIVVGGLVLDRSSISNEGFPFLRNIPLLNLLTAGRGNEKAEKEVTIYVTPRIWEPSMFTPLIGPGALGGDEKTGLLRK